MHTKALETVTAVYSKCVHYIYIRTYKGTVYMRVYTKHISVHTYKGTIYIYLAVVEWHACRSLQ